MVGNGGVELDRPWRSVSWVAVVVASNELRPADPVEVACLPIDGGRPQRVQSWLVRPPRPISGFMTGIHGITNDDVEHAPLFGEVAGEIREATAGRVVVGHRLQVDLDVLDRAVRGGWRPPVSVDTMHLARALWPGRRTYGLHALAEDVGAQEPVGELRYRAGHDVVLAAAVICALAEAGGEGGTVSARELVLRALPPRRPRPDGHRGAGGAGDSATAGRAPGLRG